LKPHDRVHGSHPMVGAPLWSLSHTNHVCGSRKTPSVRPTVAMHHRQARGEHPDAEEGLACGAFQPRKSEQQPPCRWSGRSRAVRTPAPTCRGVRDDVRSPCCHSMRKSIPPTPWPRSTRSRLMTSWPFSISSSLIAPHAGSQIGPVKDSTDSSGSTAMRGVSWKPSLRRLRTGLLPSICGDRPLMAPPRRPSNTAANSGALSSDASVGQPSRSRRTSPRATASRYGGRCTPSRRGRPIVTASNSPASGPSAIVSHRRRCRHSLQPEDKGRRVSTDPAPAATVRRRALFDAHAQYR
jgi:hypothetical protein